MNWWGKNSWVFSFVSWSKETFLHYKKRCKKIECQDLECTMSNYFVLISGNLYIYLLHILCAWHYFTHILDMLSPGQGFSFLIRTFNNIFFWSRFHLQCFLEFEEYFSESSNWTEFTHIPLGQLSLYGTVVAHLGWLLLTHSTFKINKDNIL